MRQHLLISHFSVDAFAGKENDILCIGSLDANHASAGRGTGGEYRSILRSAVAAACLVEMILQRQWDHIFHIIGTQVFIQFKNEDLLERHQRPAADVIPYLIEFDEWIRALLDVHARGVALQQERDAVAKTAASPSIASTELEAALLVIDRLRQRHLEDGRSMHEIYLTWVRRLARMEKFQVAVCALDGTPAAVTMPSRSRLPDAASTRPGPDISMRSRPGYKVIAYEDGWLIVTSSNEKYLISRKLLPNGLPEGATFRFNMEERIPMRGWCLFQPTQTMKPT